MITFEKVTNLEELVSLANQIWHEYWTEILSIEQIDYMVEKFQSEQAIKNQINNENYIYFFIKKNNNSIGYIGLSKKEKVIIYNFTQKIPYYNRVSAMLNIQFM